jgi:hypothetical protein
MNGCWGIMLQNLILTLIITLLIVRSSFFLITFQFLISFAVVGSMHKAFNDSNWALLPEQLVREQILLALQRAKAKMGAVSGNNSSWPFLYIRCAAFMHYHFTVYDSM